MPTNWRAIKAMPVKFIPFYLEMTLIKLQFLININSISIISWVLLSISIPISITKTGPYQYQYVINFSKFSLSISIPISISQFFPINISLSMHCATLFHTFWTRPQMPPSSNLSFSTNHWLLLRMNANQFWLQDLVQQAVVILVLQAEGTQEGNQ